MSEHREFEELVALDALSALDASEKARLEAHLASGCDPCLTASRDAKRVADELPAAAPPSTPSESVPEFATMRWARNDVADFFFVPES